jgi:hypothetical protein
MHVNKMNGNKEQGLKLITYFDVTFTILAFHFGSLYPASFSLSPFPRVLPFWHTEQKTEHTQLYFSKPPVR